MTRPLTVPLITVLLITACGDARDAAMGPDLLTCSRIPEARGTVFVNVHPEVVCDEDGEPRLCRGEECDDRIISTGIVSVPAHPVEPEADRDIHVWPYDLEAHWEDGWGYSNGPPTVAGVVALMRSVDQTLTPADLRAIIRETAVMRDGFPVLDAAAAVSRAATWRTG
jgi:hypothetical protein